MRLIFVFFAITALHFGCDSPTSSSNGTIGNPNVDTELEGTWKEKYGDITFIFTKNRFSFLMDSSELAFGSFSIDTTKNPKWIDMKAERYLIEPKYDGLTSLGVYTLNSNLLSLSFNEPGNNLRTHSVSDPVSFDLIRIK